MSSMKKSDLFLMAIQNLKNRKSRTKLTVIGVVIGTCAIVIMVSIGVGINTTITSMYSTSSATHITVSSPVYDYAQQGEEKQRTPLDDSAVEYLKSIDGVNAVIPIINMNEGVGISRGKYIMTNASVVGVNFDQLEQLGVKFLQGEKLDNKSGNIAYFGERAVLNFADKRGGSVKYEVNSNNEITECEINPMTDTFYIGAVDTSAENQSANTQLKDKLRVAGVIKIDGGSSFDSASSVFVDMNTAKKLVNDYNKLTTGEKKSNEYSEIYVHVKDIDSVKAVQDNVRMVGLESYSDQDSLDSTKKIMMVVQLVLGAIGAVSMFVAAFGISNTMVMAVYERTKEIGVMKVIGCDIADIKALFLCEAGIIGLMGGAIGVVISWIVSLIANAVASVVLSSMGAEAGMAVTVSSVPWWLALLGVGFATLVGVVSGLSPASRAVKVSALKAIHNE